jgi:SET domain-containing protein
VIRSGGTGAPVRALTAFAREIALPDRDDVVPTIRRRWCRFRLFHARSPIHRWGIYTAHAIPSRRRVIEYTGERIGDDEIRRRSLRHHLYLFWCGPGRAIDGAIGGSGAEFVNHCCEPNLRVSIVRGRIFFVSLRPIRAGEELTLDYNIMGDVAVTTCRCGAATCRGSMRRPDH